MYNRVTTRKIARTDGPNTPSRVAQTVDLVVAKWIPVTAALLACAVTPVRPKLDVRRYEWQPSFAWVATVANTPVRTYSPATSAELQSFTTRARPSLDVRRYEWNSEETSWISGILVTAPTVAQTLPAFQSNGLRTASPRLDVRFYDWTADEASWIQANQAAPVATVDQTAPAWSQSQSFRTRATKYSFCDGSTAFGVPPDWNKWVPLQDTGGLTRDRARLDVRRYEWTVDESSWIQATQTPVVPPTVAQTWPAFQQIGARTIDRARLEVRSYDWTADESAWIQATQAAPTAPTVAQTAPAFTSQAQSYRTAVPARPLDLFRAHISTDFGIPDDWITWVPQQDDGGRTRDRARLDVRGYEWSQPAWITNAIPATTPPTTAQAWAGILERGQYRTPARPSLDVRGYEWIQAAWITTSIPVDVAPTVAQTWPATQDRGGLYRTGARPSLDVRAYEWAPAFAWVQPVVDATTAALAPAFRAELAAFRTEDRSRLDLRRYDWAPDAASWILVSFAPPATTAQIWPAILENLGTEYQTAARPRLDVRRYEWAPEFTWAARIVDATVAKWIPTFDAQWSPVTIAARRLDVRAITDSPELGWIDILEISLAPHGALIVLTDAAVTDVAVSDALALSTGIVLSDAAVTTVTISDNLLVT